MTKSQYLDVFLHDKPVGTLSYGNKGQMIFHYIPQYTKQPNARPLSISMPLQEEPFSHAITEAFFSGLLPEDIVRRRIARYLRISEGNTFALLEAIGGECAGAVSVYARGKSPEQKTAESRYRILEEQEAHDIMIALDKRPMLAGDGDIRISGAGAQDKLIVALCDGKIAIPLGRTPSTHIIKPEIKDLKDSVQNELFSMKLAKAVGLPVAECSIFYIKDKPYYLVERYDRIRLKNGSIQRLHQEDFCQALHIPPDNKYESTEGGPSLQQSFSLLDERIKSGDMAGANKIWLLKGVIFNYLIGNGDAHGKNYSLLYKDDAVELAPFYDLMCTLYYGNAFKAKMAMKLGGKYQFRGITLRHFEKLAEIIGFKAPFVKKEVLEMVEKVQEKAPILAAELNSSDRTESSIYDEIINIIHKQCAQLKSL